MKARRRTATSLTVPGGQEASFHSTPLSLLSPSIVSLSGCIRLRVRGQRFKRHCYRDLSQKGGHFPWVWLYAIKQLRLTNGFD